MSAAPFLFPSPFTGEGKGVGVSTEHFTQLLTPIPNLPPSRGKGLHLHAALRAARAACFRACAIAASRTHAPSSHALTRVRSRSRLHGPLPFTTLYSSSKSMGPKS